MPSPFILVCPSSRGLSFALTRHLLKTTALPVYATHRSGEPETLKQKLISQLDVDPARLNLLALDLSSESSISQAAESLTASLKSHNEPFIHTAFLAGGILHAEKQPQDLDVVDIKSTFDINVISHLLLIKHFSRFLPPPQMKKSMDHGPTKWVHVSARVGSISDNRLGGWYSYRASKAALNQVVKTFDLHLAQKNIPAICVGMHPGTVKTDLSKDFWRGVREDQLFEPEDAAEKLVRVVDDLGEEHRGRIWDWAQKEVLP
ncbi:hypothetical protein EDD18DRAFT_1346855 [Armillaria luteobubalina]|uniref:NAD(P)-binding protein n=1 Tax=Armillaria luteobubalina TaxID=153913 RepID=A0AA39V1X6_9AGAR|nr:hypothetical protein EDD18DRAFT_1346855 [Armillaria luteobubalina]